jgi:hypothetical protein
MNQKSCSWWFCFCCCCDDAGEDSSDDDYSKWLRWSFAKSFKQ